MSVTIDSTNPRIIADNIRKLDDAVQSAASELPEVETTDEGKVLTVNSSGKWSASDLPGSIPKDYTTTEQDTGVKWIDGKTIYRRVISDTTQTTGNKFIPLSYDKIISYSGVVFNSDGLEVDFNKYLRVITTSNKDNLLLSAPDSASLQGTEFYLIVYYTKPSATLNMTASPDRELNASPEIDAASEPEADAEIKKVTKKKTTKKEEE